MVIVPEYLIIIMGYFLSFLHKYICCGYSSAALPHIVEANTCIKDHSTECLGKQLFFHYLPMTSLGENTDNMAINEYFHLLLSWFTFKSVLHMTMTSSFSCCRATISPY